MAAPVFTDSLGGTIVYSPSGWVNSSPTATVSGVVTGVQNSTDVGTDLPAWDDRAPRFSRVTDIGTRYGAIQNIGAVLDATAQKVCFVGVQGKNFAAGSVYVAFISGVTVNDGYRAYRIDGSSNSVYLLGAFATIPFAVEPTSPSFFEENNFNPAAVRAIEIFAISATSSASIVQHRVWIDVGRIFVQPTVSEGDVATPASFTTFAERFGYQKTIPSPALWDLGSSSFFSFIPLQFGYSGANVYVDLTGQSLEFVPVGVGNEEKLGDNFCGVKVVLGSASTAILRRVLIKSSNRKVEFSFSSHVSADVTIENFFVDSPGSTYLDAQFIHNGGSWLQRDEIDLNGAAFNRVLVRDSPDNGILLSTASSITECTISNNTGAGIRIDINGSASYDLSTNTATLSNNGGYDLLVENTTPGTNQTYNIDISGLTQAVSSTTPTPIYVDDGEATNIYNISTNASYSSSDASSAGATVNIIAPTPTLTITGIPAGGIFTIWDDEIADPQDLGTALQTTDPTDGLGIDYVGTAGNAVVYQFVPNTGASANFQEFNISGVIPATSQTLDLSSALEPETNI